MTAPATNASADEPSPAVVLICQGCGCAWEPHNAEWSAEYLRALASGCPECGDWLYLGELVVPAPRSGERR